MKRRRADRDGAPTLLKDLRSSATRNAGDDFALRDDRADQHTAVRGTPPETRRAAGPTTRSAPAARKCDRWEVGSGLLVGHTEVLA